MRRDTRRTAHTNRRRPARITTGPRRNEITAGRVAAETAKAYGRWVRRSPDTRGLGTALVGLYPAGQVGYLAATDPRILAAFAPPAALATWVGTYKAHHSRRYSATVTVTAAGIPAWLAVAAESGIFHMPVLLGYTTAAVLAWSGYTWSDVLKARRAWKAEQARWETIAATSGLENSRLVRVEDTRLGQSFTIDVRSTGSTAPRLARSDLRQRIAAVLALPAERVRVTEDRKHAGQVFIGVQMRDPWAEAVTHPALTGASASAGQRSVMDAPFVLGEDPDTGRDLELVVFDTAGGHHTFLVAPTRKGKSVVYYNIVEQATARRDVLVWGIDLGKGHLPGVCGPMLDASAGIKDHAQALRILQWAVTVIEARSMRTIGNHTPTPTAPVVIVLIDEMDTLTGTDSPIAHKAKPLVDAIFRRGGSAGVVIATAGQRGVIQHTGSKEAHANAENKIVLRVNRASEMGNVIPDWEIDGMPNMATYVQGVRGVALVVDGDGQWRAGRIRDLSDIPAVQQLAAQRGSPTATLEPDIAATLPGYTNRQAPDTSGQPGAGPLIPAARNSDDNSRESATNHRRHERQWDPNADDPTIARLAQGLVAEVESRLANMPTPPNNPTSLADLVSAKSAFEGAEDNDPATNRAIPVPRHIADPILDLLAERGEAGARRDELVDAAGRSTSVVANWLKIMRDHGRIVAHGSGRAARYLLPEFTGEQLDEDPADPEDQ